MRASTVFTLFVGAAAAFALAQEPSQSNRDPEHGGLRSQDPPAQGSTTTPTATTDTSSVVTGQVVRYEAGRMIVVKDAKNQERTFNLGAGVSLPVDIHVGSYVELATESNGVNVTRVQAASGSSGSFGMSGTSGSTSGGNSWGISGSSSSGRLPAAGATGTSGSAANAWISGTVTAYTPGQSVTISMPGGTTVQYRLDSITDIPTDLAIGKSVKIQAEKGSEGSEPIARRVTYTTKAPTHKKTTSSQR